MHLGRLCPKLDSSILDSTENFQFNFALLQQRYLVAQLVKKVKLIDAKTIFKDTKNHDKKRNKIVLSLLMLSLLLLLLLLSLLLLLLSLLLLLLL